MTTNEELISKLNQITEMAEIQQQKTKEIIDEHEEWKRKFFKRIFEKHIDNK